MDGNTLAFSIVEDLGTIDGYPDTDGNINIINNCIIRILNFTGDNRFNINVQVPHLARNDNEFETIFYELILNAIELINSTPPDHMNRFLFRRIHSILSSCMSYIDMDRRMRRHLVM